MQGLWVLAPAAAEGTPLEEDHRADPRAIVHAEALHVEDEEVVRSLHLDDYFNSSRLL
jgi:hypothetical protein